MARWEEDSAGSNTQSTEGGRHEGQVDQQPMRHGMV